MAENGPSRVGESKSVAACGSVDRAQLWKLRLGAAESRDSETDLRAPVHAAPWSTFAVRGSGEMNQGTFREIRIRMLL